MPRDKTYYEIACEFWANGMAKTDAERKAGIARNGIHGQRLTNLRNYRAFMAAETSLKAKQNHVIQ